MPYILIVEDHKDFRQAVRRFLELNNVSARMLEASSGEEGVLISRRLKPRLVLMDFCLRGINGIEAAQQIKEHDPKCNIIMLTMFDPKEIGSVSGKNVINSFIGKSDLYEQLIPSVQKALYN